MELVVVTRTKYIYTYEVRVMHHVYVCTRTEHVADMGYWGQEEGEKKKNRGLAGFSGNSLSLDPFSCHHSLQPVRHAMSLVASPAV